MAAQLLEEAARLLEGPGQRCFERARETIGFVVVLGPKNDVLEFREGKPTVLSCEGARRQILGFAGPWRTWGASRHALTVGFVGTMILGVGQRIRPAFAGMRLLWSPKLMFVGLFLLTLGCTLRVSCEYWCTRVLYGSFRFHS